MTISEDRADRIEQKIDVLTTAVNRLAIIDERQIEAGRRTGIIEDRIAKTEQKLTDVEKKLDKWVNMGIGAWALIGTLFAVYQAFAPIIHK